MDGLSPKEPCVRLCVAQRDLAARQRERAMRGRTSITGDMEAEVFVNGLIGAGFCFSQVEDYHMALEWAVRAYRQGLAGQTMSDVIRAGRELQGGDGAGDES